MAVGVVNRIFESLVIAVFGVSCSVAGKSFRSFEESANDGN